MQKTIKTALFYALLCLTPFAVANTIKEQIEPIPATQTVEENSVPQEIAEDDSSENNDPSDIQVKWFQDEPIAEHIRPARKTRGFTMPYELPPERDPIQDGLNAYKNRYYGDALKYFEHPKAQENAEIQYRLGLIYGEGLGIGKDPVLAKKWFEKAAHQNQAQAQYNLANIYRRNRDHAQAHFWYQKAAELGEPRAQHNMGTFYHKGIGVKQDYQKALYWYHKAGEGGNTNTQNLLGSVYLKGLGVKPDSKKALYWFNKAAESGDVDAQYNLGMIYEGTESSKKAGIKPNPELAAKWYKKAADNGHLDALYKLGVRLEKGLGIPKDQTKAVELYRQAAKLGHAAAQYELAFAYEKGVGVLQDNKQAAYWYKQAQFWGHADAQKGLDRIAALNKKNAQDYAIAKGGAQNDLFQSVPKGNSNATGLASGKPSKEGELQLAAKQGDSEAQYNLAAFYRKKGDYSNAIIWHQKAAEQGYVKSQYDLGLLYSGGSAKVKPDSKKAIYWYQKASEQGYANAQKDLGYLYSEGKGTTVDYAKAKYWLQKAADKNDAEAQNNLAMIYRKERNYSEMHKWLAKAVEQKYPAAFYQLGQAYEQGLGVPENNVAAFASYEQAAKLKHYDSTMRIAQAYQKGELGRVADAKQAEIWFRQAEKIKSKTK